MRALVLGLARQPFVILFLVVAAGYALGRVKVKGIGLGATASTLIVGLAFSLIAARAGSTIAIPEFASTIFFNIFMFSIGMKVGPQFLSGLRRDAKRFIAIGLLIPIAAFALTFLVRAFVDLPRGMLPGLFAGANTATPGLGSAQAAYSGEGLSEDALKTVVATMSTAFAFTYCISTVLFVLLTKLPDLFGRDLVKSAKELEASIAGDSTAPLPGAGDEFFGRPLPVALRSYEIDEPLVVGHPLSELRAIQPAISVERVIRGGTILAPRDDLVLQFHDTVALYGLVELLVATGPRIGRETYDPVARDVGAETVDVVAGVKAAGRTLGELAADAGHGMYLNAIFRAGEQIPMGPETVVEKGDVLRVTGSAWRIKALEQAGGTVIKPSLNTDIVTLALGVALGALVGSISIPVGRIHLQLGSAVGLLLIGIALSIVRTRRPGFGGPYPEPARQLFEDLGLNVFVAVLGLNAGAGVITALSQGEIVPILVASVIIGALPAIGAWWLGRRAFHMNEALLLGAVAGGRCNSAGLRSAQEATSSSVPAISYPATFAISNIVFTLFAYLMALID